MTTEPSNQDGDFNRLSMGELQSSGGAMDHMQEAPMDGLASPGLTASSSLFFADATLDLSEAHDMAETPVPQRFLMSTTTKNQAPGLIDMPNLTPSSDAEEEPPFNTQRSTMTGSEHKTCSSDSTRPTANMRSTRNMNRISNEDRPRIPTLSHPPRRPQRPRDIPWAVLWVLFVPFSLCWTMSYHRDYSFYTKSLQLAVFNCLLLAYGATFVLGRLLYRTMGGGDGDDARHVATHLILMFAPISVAVYLLLSLVIFLKTPDVMGYALIPLIFLVRNLWALRQWRTQQTFFEALVCMALDILSRSLRRSSFYRMVGALMGLQLCMVVLWKLAVFGANGVFWVLIALLSGKWLTGTVARIIGLIASGGIASWFTQQSILIQEMERMKASAHHDEPTSDDASADYDVGYNQVPEEDRTADASVYQSVLDMDEGIDDDFQDEDNGSREGSNERTNPGGSTAKGFLLAAVTTSFGSVAQCGLLGGLAQFTWSVLRNADSLSTSLSQRSLGFRGMQIGQDGARGVSVIWKIVNKTSIVARSFVRTHSDLAICHVAAYYKSYQRAASDVMALVDASGVEPIIHDDMTTHMCACVCSSISGLIVIIVGTIVSHRRPENVSDEAIVQSMLLAFIFCYTLLFTVMEPLRASIKAIYVCFAEHPQSLSQAFPLIFHRLSRISEANLV